MGEEEAVAVYSFGIGVYLALEIMAVVAAHRLLPDSLLWVGLALLTMPHTLVAAQRRAIIFTDKQVIYRPALLNIKRAELSDILHIRTVRVPIPLGLLCVIAVPGVGLTFATRFPGMLIPLDTTKRDEILRRLGEAADKPVTKVSLSTIVRYGRPE